VRILSLDLPVDVIGWIAIGAAVAVLGLLLALFVQARRLSRLRRAYASALDPDRREDLFESVQRQAEALEALRQDINVVHGNTQHLRELLRGSVSRVGLVRYDAFADMGGALSFSAALLDEDGHGIVVSAINGRSETRCYAKPVRASASATNLSDEEAQAIQAALEGRKGEVTEVAAKRGRRRAS
jgi:hypothetical protein